ncbi:hypothetical protein EfmAA818_34090 (plasmid) [Enterococcus faecium]|nr:hypothetical protein EfmAA818_34090 [Enterococcus faecium]
MSKKGTIINEWEKLTAPSNRRLSVDDKVHPVLLQSFKSTIK